MLAKKTPPLSRVHGGLDYYFCFLPWFFLLLKLSRIHQIDYGTGHAIFCLTKMTNISLGAVFIMNAVLQAHPHDLISWLNQKGMLCALFL